MYYGTYLEHGTMTNNDPFMMGVPVVVEHLVVAMSNRVLLLATVLVL